MRQQPPTIDLSPTRRTANVNGVVVTGPSVALTTAETADNLDSQANVCSAFTGFEPESPVFSGVCKLPEARMNEEQPEVIDDQLTGETPEDVAVLYSWANLQGAKYRDFSASRREYRAQLRHRAAEEQRLAEARAQAEAEAAAAAAEKAAREAEEAARFHETAARRAAQANQNQDVDAEVAAKDRAMRHAAEMSRIAAVERMEAARRSEAVAAAEAASRREAREIEEARVSGERQAARYAESEHRRRERSGSQPLAVPGQISDPYQSAPPQTAPGRIFHQPSVPEPRDDMRPSRHPQNREARLILPQPDPSHPRDVIEREYLATGSLQQDAEIAVRGTHAISEAADEPDSPIRHYYHDPNTAETAVAVDQYARISRSRSSDRHVVSSLSRKVNHPPPDSSFPTALKGAISSSGHSAASVPAAPSRTESEARASYRPFAGAILGPQPILQASRAPQSARIPDLDQEFRPSAGSILGHEPPSPHRVEHALKEMSAGQRAYAIAKAEAAAKSEAAQEAVVRRGYSPDEASGFFPAYGSARAEQVYQQNVAAAPQVAERVVPEWIQTSSGMVGLATNPTEAPSNNMTSLSNIGVAAHPPLDTLQNSRERVAARWYALKGVFDHGQEQLAELEAQRERERPVPLVAVFSLAGGVGKTSIVATLGRALSAEGEHVLMTDTTSHGLLPFYFGASELRPGILRTFSPPSGTSDAPIALVSYDIPQKPADAPSQNWLAAEVASKAKGMSRVILDLSATAPWAVKRLAQMDATLLIPVLPDMNSVISLGAMEKFFSEIKDSQGKAAEPYYVLNQFDSSQPLHLDVREVMRLQLAERLLPFVLRRAPAVPEALAEGMTVMDYAPESPIAEDFRNLASWLQTHAVPASAEKKNVRWSER